MKLNQLKRILDYIVKYHPLLADSYVMGEHDYIVIDNPADNKDFVEFLNNIGAPFTIRGGAIYLHA